MLRGLTRLNRVNSRGVGGQQKFWEPGKNLITEQSRALRALSMRSRRQLLLCPPPALPTHIDYVYTPPLRSQKKTKKKLSVMKAEEGLGAGLEPKPPVLHLPSKHHRSG